MGQKFYTKHKKYLKEGFSVEIDVFILNGRYYLGHDIHNLIQIRPKDIDLQNVFVQLKTPSSPYFKNADSFFIDKGQITYTYFGRQWVNTCIKDCFNSNTIGCSNELTGGEINEGHIIDVLKNSSWVCTKKPLHFISLLSLTESIPT